MCAQEITKKWLVAATLLVAFLLHSAAGQLPPAPEAVFPWAALQDARIIEYNQRICFTYPRIWQPAVGEQKWHIEGVRHAPPVPVAARHNGRQ